MAMTERAYAYQEAQSYELRRMRVLDGTAARQRANERRGDIVKLTVGVLAVLVYLLGVTFMQAKVDSAALEINELKAAITETEDLSEKADLEIGRRASLSYIESYAINNLGMVYPAMDNLYLLDEESSLSIAQGRAEVVMAADAAAAEEQPHPFWQNIGATLENFFLGTALAAGE